MIDSKGLGLARLDETDSSHRSAKQAIWVSAITVAIYPWILQVFHWIVTLASEKRVSLTLTAGYMIIAAFFLICAFGVSLINLIIAGRAPVCIHSKDFDLRTRRFALIAITAPTTYVFFGVLTYMAGIKIPDPWVWSPAWLLLGYWVSRGSSTANPQRSTISSTIRVLHGISGAVVALYVIFHIFNHLFGLISPEAHGAIMNIGRLVYRSAAVEPVLIAAMLFQITTGLRLAWVWSSSLVDRYRLLQVASGIFMSVFILGHMNSVFFFARSFLNIPTDWAFATGLPAGLIHDAWNIRLVPHYSLGVFMVLAHLSSGMRIVMLSHNINPLHANNIWRMGVGFSALISIAIMCGMTGLRV